ncbi:hypothetical protein Goshw_014339 [Gossypium schwendimanii]|uniref:Uncharacterized protein n=1 Tax=Gossypium schwendimanii TaxID=34291 RepID=A0A7J9NDK4_GOSSC|nr:hypothetical protein [Gossypium schwendimanii]
MDLKELYLKSFLINIRMLFFLIIISLELIYQINLVTHQFLLLFWLITSFMVVCR